MENFTTLQQSMNEVVQYTFYLQFKLCFNDFIFKFIARRCLTTDERTFPELFDR
jgi:hypothetical protein